MCNECKNCNGHEEAICVEGCLQVGDFVYIPSMDDNDTYLYRVGPCNVSVRGYRTLNLHDIEVVDGNYPVKLSVSYPGNEQSGIVNIFAKEIVRGRWRRKKNSVSGMEVY